MQTPVLTAGKCLVVREIKARRDEKIRQEFTAMFNEIRNFDSWSSEEEITQRVCVRLSEDVFFIAPSAIRRICCNRRSLLHIKYIVGEITMGELKAIRNQRINEQFAQMFNDLRKSCPGMSFVQITDAVCKHLGENVFFVAPTMIERTVRKWTYMRDWQPKVPVRHVEKC